jgi:hypothetical protein
VLWTKPFPGRQGAFPHKPPRLPNDTRGADPAKSRLLDEPPGWWCFLSYWSDDFTRIRSGCFATMLVFQDAGPCTVLHGVCFFYSRESRLVRGSKQGGGFRSTPVSAGIVFNPQSSARDLSAPYSDSCGSTLISPVSRVDAHNFLRVCARPRRERR